MTDINTVTITGRIVRDLGERDFTYFASGTAKARVSVAVNKGVKNANGSWSEKSAFFDVVIWGKPAEALRPHLVKGAKVTVHGSLEQDTWQDKQTGAKREKIYITAANVQLLQAAQPSQARQTAAQATQQAAAQPAEFEDDWPDGFNPNAVPF